MLENKKALHIQASGSVLSEGSLEMSHRHLDAIMKFIGVKNIEALFIEGMAASPDEAPSIKEKAIQRAYEPARKF